MRFVQRGNCCGVPLVTQVRLGGKSWGGVRLISRSYSADVVSCTTTLSLGNIDSKLPPTGENVNMGEFRRKDAVSVVFRGLDVRHEQAKGWTEEEGKQCNREKARRVADAGAGSEAI